MKPNRFLLLLGAFVIVTSTPIYVAYAEEEDVELALEPPDEGAEAVNNEALSEEERRLQELVEEEQGDLVADPNRREPAEADVPQLSDGRYDTRESNQQQKILRYHRERLDGREYLAFEGEEDPPHRFHGSLGVHFGIYTPSVTQGNVEFQVSASNHFAIGVKTDFSNMSILLALTANYYSRRPYEGIWVQLGFGYDYYRTLGVNLFNDSTIRATTPILFEMGWRYLGDNNLTFAFCAGVNGYFFVPRPFVYFNTQLQIGLAFNVFPH